MRKLSPYLFSQFGILNHRHLPKERDLPLKGLLLKAIVFDFGFNNAANVIAPFQEADLSIPIRRNLLVWAITGNFQVVSTAAAPPALVSPPLLFQVTQQHEAKLFQWFNKPVPAAEQLGTATKPNILKDPHLVIAGDALNVDVQNSGNYNLAAQVVLYGGEFE